jgi:hypothetical protein
MNRQNGGEIDHHPIETKTDMNTKHLTLTLAVAAAALVPLTLRADEIFLSPRARENQASTAAGVTEDRLQRGLLPGSPRGRTQKIREVSGVDTDPNLVTRNRDVTARPRAISTFPWLAQTARARPGTPEPSHSCCKP